MSDSVNTRDYENFNGSNDNEKLLTVSISDKPSSDPQLPTPVSAQSPRSKPKLHATTIIPIWMALSSTVILYNNYLYSTLEFRYPVFLVTWHLTFAVSFLSTPNCYFNKSAQAIGTRVLQRTTHLLDAANDIHVSKEMFFRSFLPIGVSFSASLILSNTAYLYLSVAYIQMLKVRAHTSIITVPGRLLITPWYPRHSHL
jgi:hypothetical protein